MKGQSPKTPLRPPHPERICWGCEKYCPADDLGCGNGTIRTPHPCELFGDDWFDWRPRPVRQTPENEAAGSSGQDQTAPPAEPA